MDAGFRRYRALAFGCVFALAASATVAAQGSPPRDDPRRADADRSAALGTIDGLVSDSSLAPIAGATVSILRSSVQVETLASGRFRILKLPAGQYLIVVRKVGYRPASGIIELRAGEDLLLAYTLEHSLPTLDTMRVMEQRLSLKMTDFEARRKTGEGHFITQDEIEHRNVPFSTDLARGVLGFQVVKVDKMGHSAILSTRGGTSVRGCVPELFIDGIRQNRPASDDNLPSPKEIAGIELYSGSASAPLQYGKGGSCGVILVWTRDGTQ